MYVMKAGQEKNVLTAFQILIPKSPIKFWSFIVPYNI